MLNNSIVEEIKTKLERLSQFPVIKSLRSKLCTGEYLQREYQKIVSAREKEYPTYRSEYRVIKILIRQRNQLIYQLWKSEGENCETILKEFITLSKLLKRLLKSIGEIFSEEQSISDVADEFDKTYL